MRLSIAFHSSHIGRAIRRHAITGLIAVGIVVASTNTGGNVIANGDSRTLSIRHMHTGESLTVTYKRNGMFDRDALEKLNWILRDWRRNESTSMDPRLFDIVWEAHRQVGSNDPIQVVSAYRSPETNSMLRRRSNGVAKNSQHMLGKAMDFYIPDVSINDIREVALKMQRGGVGYYPRSHTPFVHLDAGSVRHWPRMSHDQLARIFPDGKTVHLPSSGKPLERYAQAEAEILANGGTVMGMSYAGGEEEENVNSGGSGKSLWAALFGGSDEDDTDAAPVKPSPVRVAARPAPVDDDDAPATKKLALKSPAQPINSVAAVPLPSLRGYKLAAPGKAPLPPLRPESVAIAETTVPALPRQVANVPLPPVRPDTPEPARVTVASAAPLPPQRVVFDGSETTGSLRAAKLALPKVIAGDRKETNTPPTALAYAPSVPAEPKIVVMPQPRPTVVQKQTAPKPVPTALTMTTSWHDGNTAVGFTKTNSVLPQGKFAKLPIATSGSFSSPQ